MPARALKTTADAGREFPVEGTMPSLRSATAWLNSPPLTPRELRGNAVLVDFWTYSCINCLRSLPYIEAWARKYKDHGLVVIGIHAPEFAFEKDIDKFHRAVRDLGITYPVALDNDLKIWQAFDNEYWPARGGKNRHITTFITRLGKRSLRSEPRQTGGGSPL